MRISSLHVYCHININLSMYNMSMYNVYIYKPTTLESVRGIQKETPMKTLHNMNLYHTIVVIHMQLSEEA